MLHHSGCRASLLQIWNFLHNLRASIGVNVQGDQYNSGEKMCLYSPFSKQIKGIAYAVEYKYLFPRSLFTALTFQYLSPGVQIFVIVVSFVARGPYNMDKRY